MGEQKKTANMYLCLLAYFTLFIFLTQPTPDPGSISGLFNVDIQFFFMFNALLRVR